MKIIQKYFQAYIPWNSKEEEFEDTKEVIRIRKSKKDRQHNAQKKKYKGTKIVMYTFPELTDNMPRRVK
jgi:hypothetical protein